MASNESSARLSARILRLRKMLAVAAKGLHDDLDSSDRPSACHPNSKLAINCSGRNANNVDSSMHDAVHALPGASPDVDGNPWSAAATSLSVPPVPSVAPSSVGSLHGDASLGMVGRVTSTTKHANESSTATASCLATLPIADHPDTIKKMLHAVDQFALLAADMRRVLMATTTDQAPDAGPFTATPSGQHNLRLTWQKLREAAQAILDPL